MPMIFFKIYSGLPISYICQNCFKVFALSKQNDMFQELLFSKIIAVGTHDDKLLLLQ